MSKELEYFIKQCPECVKLTPNPRDAYSFTKIPLGKSSSQFISAQWFNILFRGRLDSVEWNGGLERWNGMMEWNGGLE